MAGRMAYTNPVNVPARWPFIVTNPFDLRHFRWYVERYGDSVVSVLVDTGVHWLFRDPGVRDYPGGFLERYVGSITRVAWLLERYAPGAELLYVVPDIPADYPGRERWYPWNVERTAWYARLFLKRYVGRLPGRALAVVQGRRDDPWSVVRAYLDHYDVYGEYDLLALGNVCSSRRPLLVAREIALFDRVAHTHYHAFGVHTRALRVMAERGVPACRLRSVDSSSYYWDFHYRGGRGKTGRDKARILRWRMSRIQELLDRIPCRGGLQAWLPEPATGTVAATPA